MPPEKVEAIEFRPATPPPESLKGKTVWVVDSHSLIYQVFHAMSGMTGPGGRPIGAVLGFTRDLLDLLEKKKPDYLFCAFDLPGKTFRHAMYDQYKAHRKPMPEDLIPQIGSIHRVLRALHIPAIGCESFEADDVLATMARLTEQLSGKCFLVTSDKDCRQLITDRVKLYNIRKDQILGREELEDDWGIAAEQVVDYQALVGDSVDNVPGVPLIGPKIARELLSKYITLDAVLDHANEVSGKKRKENLINFRDQALLSRKLVRLDADVPVAIDWEAGRVEGIDGTAASALFEEFDFQRLKTRLSTMADVGTPPPSTPAVEAEYRLVDTPEVFETFLAQLQQQEWISLDTETTSVIPRQAKIVGYSFAWRDDEGWYLPVRAPEGEPCLDPKDTLEALRPILENPAVKKVGQNLKYEIVVLRSAGVELAGVEFDTMVADYLLRAGYRGHKLGDLSRLYLGHTASEIEELIGTGKNQKRMDEVPVDAVTDYAGEDAVLPWRLRPILAKKLADAELEDLFSDVEMPLVDVLAEMEFNGIRVDIERLGELSRRYGERMDSLTDEIYELAGRPLNIASPKQLQEVLFDELKLPVIKQTAKSGPSTDVEVLEELAQKHPLPAKIIEYRQYAKLKGTYVDALPELVHPETGRVHASFNQGVTATGRLSSSDPNLQNIPVRTEEGREIRSAFVPGDDGWVLMAADYSQIELRVLAHYSEDEHLCEAFARDEDIHARVAGQVNGVSLDEVTPQMRREAKAVNFGVIYGQSAFGLAKSLGIPKEEAGQFIDNYFAGYPGIERFLDQVLADCRQNGYVSTILGRRRDIEREQIREISSRQRNLVERTAVNTVIQGSAADLIKLAMIAIHRRLRRERLEARMLLQIHDELIFEVPSDQLDTLTQLVRDEMVGVIDLSVPLKVDIKAGPDWANAEGI